MRLCLALIAGLIMPWTVGCGASKVPDGGQIDVTIPKDVAEKQNDAFKNYAKQSRRGKPPG